jgi:alkylation response protein AidB-like acyl-CoA dehydrogenase
MDFDFNDEQRLLKESAREVMEKEIIPIADEYDKGKLLHDRKRLKALLDKLAPLGYLGATIPEEDGGSVLIM